MDQALRILGLLIVGGLAMMAFAAAAVWWFAPARRIQRRLKRLLGAHPTVSALSPARGAGAGLDAEDGRIATVAGFHDFGLVYGMDELVGAELIFDGQVAARAFKGEGRRPLDHIAPDAQRVTLRLVFDDLREPEFEMELWRAGDPPGGHDLDSAVAEARRWFTHAEAVLRRS
jgi:hypothetical protein